MGKTHVETLIESPWLGQWDLGTRTAIVEIESVHQFIPLQRREKKDPRTGEMKAEVNNKLDIALKGKRKHWIAGPVSRARLKKLFGPYVEDWIGQKIELYVDPDVKMGRERTGGIRVRPVIPKGAVTSDPLDNAAPPEDLERIEAGRQSAAESLPVGREPGQEG